MAVSLVCGCGCGRGRGEERLAPPGLESPWYVLREGRLLHVDGIPRSATETDDPEYRPWTVQERITDLLVRDGRIYLTINGYGVLSAAMPLEPTTRFEELYDPGIFGGRTITEMLADRVGIVLHLYANRTLDPLAPFSPAGGGVSFIEIRDQGAGTTAAPSSIPVPFQSVHPDWEAVAVVRTSAEEVDVEWKRTDATRTEFAYTRLEWRSGTETAIDRATFRAAYRLASPSSSGVAVEARSLFEALLRHMKPAAGSGTSTALHMVLRTDGRAAERYRYQPPGYAEEADIDLVSIQARRVGSVAWALAPDGTLLAAAAGSRDVLTQSLPPLPPSHSYTGFALSGDSDRPEIAASWEEIRFTSVGSAGLYVGAVRAPGR